VLEMKAADTSDLTKGLTFQRASCCDKLTCVPRDTVTTGAAEAPPHEIETM